MAEEIIDLRDRIEKMRVQIENEGTEQIKEIVSREVFQKTKSSNITLSMESKKFDANQHSESMINNQELKTNENIPHKNKSKSETFPSVSLSVKNPLSNKILIAMFVVQIFSNFGILYLLYKGME
jgi:hypothetical protein